MIQHKEFAKCRISTTVVSAGRHRLAEFVIPHFQLESYVNQIQQSEATLFGTRDQRLELYIETWFCLSKQHKNCVIVDTQTKQKGH